MTSVHSASDTYKEYAQAKAEGYFPSAELECVAGDCYFPTIELKLDALQREFPGDHDLEPIETTITPLVKSGTAHGTDATLSTGVAHLESSPVFRSVPENQSELLNDTGTAAKNLRDSALTHKRNSVKLVNTASLQPIMRSTSKPAPSIPQSGSTGEPKPRSQAPASQGTSRSTNIDDIIDSNRGPFGLSADSTIRKSSLALQHQATSSMFPPVQGFSYLTPMPPATEAFKTPFNELASEDSEMSCSDPSPPEIFRGVPEGSFPAVYNYQDAFWIPMRQSSSNTAVFPSFTSSYVDPMPQASAFLTASHAVAELPNMYSVPFESDPHQSLLSPPPHPSIFELIKTESPALRRPSAYIIPPVVVPNHVWQQEITREQLRYSDNTPRLSKRSRLFAPYFLRTPLVVAKNLHRGRIARTAPFSSRGSNMTNKLNCDDEPPQKCDDNLLAPAPPRSPSPAFSRSSISTSTHSSYSAASYLYGRRLSSPPPFRQRFQRLKAPTDEFRGAFRSLTSIFWPWSGHV
ncbi:hypothetical protein K438DRAFT_2006972 [Mycena galopus ATCC 62051]|nr:hypothetical protein K438DRAFT_2006972 [Mycena galopus ATCC 62051]